MSLDVFLNELHKKYGKVILPGKEIKGLEIRSVFSGILGIDIATGGIPLGRDILYFGLPQTCKSTLALKNAAILQRVMNKPVMIIDTEGSYTHDYATHCGLDIDGVYLSDPQSLEEAGDVAEATIISNEFSCVILDSVSARETGREIEKSLSLDKNENMLRAAVTNRIYRKCARASGRLGKMTSDPNHTVFIACSHIYEKPGQFVTSHVMPGGHGKEFQASLIIKLTGGQRIKSGDDIVGKTIQWQVTKSKISPPDMTGAFDFYYQSMGNLVAPCVNTADEVLRHCELNGMITRVGNKYGLTDHFEDLKKSEVVNYLTNNSQVLDELYSKLYSLSGFAHRLWTIE